MRPHLTATEQPQDSTGYLPTHLLSCKYPLFVPMPIGSRSILLCITLTALVCRGQTNILGKPGYILAPSAMDTPGPLQLGVNWLPSVMSFKDNNNSTGSDKGSLVYHAGVSLTDFWQINLNITYGIDRPLTGIGDRHLDTRIRLFKERRHRPALVVIVVPPGATTNYLVHNALVATKTFGRADGNEEGASGPAGMTDAPLEASLGWGAPFYLRGISLIDNKPFDWYDKRRQGLWYLNGFFAATSWKPVSWLTLSAEITNRGWAAGAGVTWKKRIGIQYSVYSAGSAGYSLFGNIPLDKRPFELRKNRR